jgi:hypothetical protein
MPMDFDVFRKKVRMYDIYQFNITW